MSTANDVILLAEKVDKLEAENKKALAHIERLKAENERLKLQLSDEAVYLYDYCWILQKKNEELREAVEKAEAKMKELENKLRDAMDIKQLRTIMQREFVDFSCHGKAGNSVRKPKEK